MHPKQYDELRPLAVRLLSIPEACDRLGCSRSYFYATPALRALIRKVGSASRVRSDELDAYILSLPAAPAEEAQR